MRWAIAFASASLAAPATLISASSVAPSPSATICDDRSRQTRAQRECECLVARRRALDLRDAGGEQHDRVVRRALAVDGDRVEARLDRGAEERDRVARLERIVGRDDREHRREVRVDHPGALGHAADREPGPVRDGRLRLRVGGENRLRRIAAAVGGERSGCGDEALLDPLERQRRADHAGREHEHLLRYEPEQRSGARGGRGCVGVALNTGRRVRDAGVDRRPPAAR